MELISRPDRTQSRHCREHITSADHEEDLGLEVGLRPARGGVLRQHNPEPVGDDTETQSALDDIKKNRTERCPSVASVSDLSVVTVWPLRPARGGVLCAHDPEPVGDDTETQSALDEIKDRIKKTKNKRPRSVDSLSDLSTLPIWPVEAGMTRVVVKYNKGADKLTYFDLIDRLPLWIHFLSVFLP